MTNEEESTQSAIAEIMQETMRIVAIPDEELKSEGERKLRDDLRAVLAKHHVVFTQEGNNGI